MESTRRVPKHNVVEREVETLQGVLTNEKDVYNSRYVSLVGEQKSSEEQFDLDEINFAQFLDRTIEHFEKSSVKGFFLTLSLTKHVNYFPILTQRSFSFHNASGDTATLVKFIPKNRKNRLPGFASHYVGVGGLVIDFESKKVLVIQEKSGHDVNGWKIPGGLVDSSEYIATAVEREVSEETGKFVHI